MGVHTDNVSLRSMVVWTPLHRSARPHPDYLAVENYGNLVRPRGRISRIRLVREEDSFGKKPQVMTSGYGNGSHIPTIGFNS
ncbi:hypothetical protein CEXT_30351 [Caerostris extrusa]|uniref:Uncharacterized protein n=1 Tax=Caerostris extrusa TaxID=172846 RepID=A0AAV4QMT6_CAEEX|nr:hypothetical protein CEXT_30351 [Caerostris extrusa]